MRGHRKYSHTNDSDLPSQKSGDAVEKIPPGRCCTSCGTQLNLGVSFCTSCGLATKSYQGSDKIARRHDLDALRAFVMFLGIVLHGALSFMEGWPIQDNQQHEGFKVAVSAIHGFRMPVFFLMSGFFTAMLWRQRGLKSLVHHRLKRVGLPLLLALVTIVPTLNCTYLVATILPEFLTEHRSNGPYIDIIEATREGDVSEVQSYLKDGLSIDEIRDNKFGVTLMSCAVLSEQKEIVELLIKTGSDVNIRNKDGATPLNAAAFLGYTEIAELLIQNGADVNAESDDGSNAWDSTMADPDTTEFLVKLLRIEIDRTNLKTGREKVRYLLNQHGGSRKNKDSQKNNQDAFSTYLKFTYSGIMSLLIFGNVFHHLWFLWFLMWLIAGFVIYAKFIGWVKWKNVLPKWALFPPINLLLLTVLTAVPQLFMGVGGKNPTFGPDTSTGILPLPHLLLYYAVFFGFGVLYFDSDDRLGKISNFWWAILPVGLFVLFPIGYELSTGDFGFGDSITAESLQRPLSVLIQAAYPWFIAFGLMGLFRKLLTRENYVIRYLSDSSYWLYLTHLPLVILAQSILQYLQIPAVVKFACICIVISSILLFTYQTIVRYTLLGTLLNGPRKRSTTDVPQTTT